MEGPGQTAPHHALRPPRQGHHNFTGWTPDGQVIASSIPDGEPWTMQMGDAIKGLAEGLALMAKGEERRLRF